MRRFLEWSFVGLVCFVLIAIALPNHTGPHERNKLSSVKSNMHTFQTILETYSVDASGNYPKNAEETYKFANAGNNKYWKDFKNPFTNETGKGKSYDDFNKKLLEKNSNTKEELKCRGCVYYDFSITEKGEVNKYFVYGSDKNGEIIIDIQSGIPFTISNN